MTDFSATHRSSVDWRRRRREDVFLKRDGRANRRKEGRGETRHERGRNRISLISSSARRMRSLIIFPLVVVAVPPSLCPPSLALSAEDDGNDSLLRTLQISPISEDGRAAVSQGRFHCCPVRGVRVLMGRLMRQSSPRARTCRRSRPRHHPTQRGSDSSRNNRARCHRITRAPPPL